MPYVLIYYNKFDIVTYKWKGNRHILQVMLSQRVFYAKILENNVQTWVLVDTSWCRKGFR